MSKILKIRDLQNQIEESLASLPDLALPPEMEGLRHLPLLGYKPRVTVYYTAESGRKRRKVRETASASYFDGGNCELTINFDPVEEPQDHRIRREPTGTASGETGGEFDPEAALDQLIDELSLAEARRPFVGLTWFRDRFLVAECAHEWARRSETVRSLLDRAIKWQLIRTSKVPNPNSPLHPTTAIRLNRSHPRFRTDATAQTSRFTPVRIRGGLISDTVLDDRN